MTFYQHQPKKTAILLEDDLVAQITLEHFCKHYPGIELAGVFDNIKDAIAFIKTHTVDLIFLDIELKSSNGFDLLPYINPETKVIVTTADPANKAKANAHHLSACLIKPISLEAFQQSLSNLQVA